MKKIVHIYTTLHPKLIEKQFPNGHTVLDDIRFTIGLKIDPNCDALILHRFGGQVIPTKLPKNRIGFICGEPADIHSFSPDFLNQFGAVWGPDKLKCKSPYFRTNYSCLWYAGIPFNTAPFYQNLRGHSFFSNLATPNKDDRISIVTTLKNQTEMHKKRKALIDAMRRRLGDKVVVYGENHSFVSDKADALLPHKYHVALENTQRDFCWTEKLSDPILCWTLPFYAGVPDTTIDLPKGSFVPIGLDNPERAVDVILDAVNTNAWEASKSDLRDARNKILHHESLAWLFKRAAEHLLSQPTSENYKNRNVVIKSEIMFSRPERSKDIKRKKRAIFCYKYFPSGQILWMRLKSNVVVILLTQPGKRIRNWHRRLQGRRKVRI